MSVLSMKTYLHSRSTLIVAVILSINVGMITTVVFHAEPGWAHSESGPYADFDAPGFQWTETPRFADGRGRISLGTGYGFIDATGKVVLQLYP